MDAAAPDEGEGVFHRTVETGADADVVGAASEWGAGTEERGVEPGRSLHGGSGLEGRRADAGL